MIEDGQSETESPSRSSGVRVADLMERMALRVDLEGVDPLTFYALTPHNSETIANFPLDISDRAFTVSVLAIAARSTKVDTGSLSALADDQLAFLAAAYAEHEYGLGSPLDDPSDPFASFRRAYRSFLDSLSVTAKMLSQGVGVSAAIGLNRLASDWGRMLSAHTSMFDTANRMTQVGHSIAQLGLNDWGTRLARSWTVGASIADTINARNDQFNEITNGLGLAGQFTSRIAESAMPMRAMIDGFSPHANGELFRSFGAMRGAFDFRQMANSLVGVQESIRKATAIELPSFDVSRFWSGLPDFSDLLERFREIVEANEDGRAALEAGGYAFLVDAVLVSAFAEFRHINPKVIKASMTKSLFAVTASPEFAERLEHNMGASRVLRRRLPAVRAALKAHRNRDYFLSIPAALAQIEGTIADALLMEGAIQRGTGRKSKKLYKLNDAGELILNKYGNPIELDGIHSLIEHADWAEDELLRGVAHLATESLARDRNDILHGRLPQYASAQRSVTYLLMLEILTRDFGVFESVGKTSRAQRKKAVRKT